MFVVNCISVLFIKSSLDQPYVRGIPDYNHPYGLIRFDRSVKPISDRTEPKSNGNDDEGFKAFQGEGFSLRKSRK